MEKQKKNDSGITLVALVVSIIVMLVLAGVSLNATIGENGIVTRAQEAVTEQRIAEQKEAIEHALTEININTLTDDTIPEIDQIARKLVANGVIDDYQRAKDAYGNPTDNVAVIIDSVTRNRCFFGIKDNNKFKISRNSEGLVYAELVNEISGGDVEGLALVTKESFGEYDENGTDPNKGKFTITSNAEVMFLDPISGNLSIYVPREVHAKVSIYAKMDLTNENVARSAIDIEPGGTLDLYIDQGVEVTVNSGFGTDPERAVGQPGKPGEGGYAGIHVPWIDFDKDNIRDNGEFAILNIKGEGKLSAYGGNAGNGSDAAKGDIGGSGGGGAGAGIGGHGGKGGMGGAQNGYDGSYGENCGEINIHNKITVYAYGGAGGSSGTLNKENAAQSGSGTGAGGYPAAGIGGGGAGGGGAQHTVGAGGYSGGACEADAKGITNYNGSTNGYTGNSAQYFGSGSYFLGSNNKVTVGGNSSNTMECRGGHIGGEGAVCLYHNYSGCTSGSGGVAGRGGIISVNYTSNTNKAMIYAYNGNKYTDGKVEHKYNDGDNQCPIYIQEGTPLDICIPNNNYTTERFSKIEYELDVDISTWTAATSYATCKDYIVKAEDRGVDYTACELYINPKSGNHQGVGSGAGYIEVSNGSYKIYNEDSSGNFTTEYTGI